jgi:hypothetical protein
MIQIWIFWPSRITDPGVKKHWILDLDPRHCLLQTTEEEKPVKVYKKSDTM